MHQTNSEDKLQTASDLVKRLMNQIQDAAKDHVSPSSMRRLNQALALLYEVRESLDSVAAERVESRTLCSAA